MGVFTRGTKLWIRFCDADGKWRNVTSTYSVGQEREAEQMHEELVRRVDLATSSGTAGEAISTAPLTVRVFADQWLEERRKLDHDWKHDRARLQHVLPAIGDLDLANVRPRHLIEAFTRIRSAKEPIAQRTLYNVYAVVSALFRDAKLAERIEQSPCVLDERQLGPKTDSDPEWREGSLFTRDEATQLISSTAIPDDRRMVYAFMLLAGMRPGEASALRWRHYDPTMRPLGRLLVALSYDSRRHREKSTKTDSTRHVPVHPTLAAMLAEWKLSGWADMMGRAPEPDDLIVPLPPADALARRTREGEPFRTEAYNGKRWREHDLPALRSEAATAGESIRRSDTATAWRHREMYAMKATFITLVLDDGADPHVIETRVTHTKKSRSAFDGYNRGKQWELTCAEVAKLKLARSELATELAIAVGEIGPSSGPIPLRSDAATAFSTGRNDGPVHQSRAATGDLVTSLVTAAACSENVEEKGLRRRASNPRPGG